MNPRIKRLLSMLLALTMVFSLTAPVSASAASTTAASGNTVEIEVGESKKLSSSGWLSKTTWTSSDETVATVSSNGTVTGVAEGTATITATSKSLFFFFGGSTKTTTYTVVVTEGAPEVPTEPEETEPEEGLTVKAGEKLQLEVNANGGTVTWKSSNKNIATVDNNGLVTGVSEGTVTITATVKKTTGGNGFWFFWWGSKTTTTKTEFEVTVLPGDEEPTEPPVTEPPVTEPPVTEPPVTEPPVVTYTVTFESNGGSEVEPQTIEEGQPATEPEAPTMEGYAFAGWYADAELTEAYDFATPITADIILYADWIQNNYDETRDEYYITFLRNDGSDIAYATVTVAPGGTVSAPADPTREGYAFTGWYTDMHCAEAFDFSQPITFDTVLFAGWGNPSGEEGLYSHSSGGGTINSITNIVVEDGQVVTTINTNSTAVLRIEFIDQNSADVVAEYAVQTPEYCEQVDIHIPIDQELPEYFLVRATLYNLNGEELTSYTSIRYTSNYQLFEQKTADDYEAEGERVVRFSKVDNTTNFGVLADGVAVIEEDGVHNIVTATTVEDESDPDVLQWSTIYTVENPTDEVLDAAEGTVLMLANPDGTKYLFKVGSVTVDENGNAIIIPAEEVYMTDFYKALKVDTSIEIVEKEIDEGTEEVEAQSGDQVQLNASKDAPVPYAEIIDVDVSPKAALGGGIEWTPKDFIKVSGTLTGSGSMDIVIKYDAKLFAEDYVECTVTNEIELTLDIDVILTIDSEPDKTVHDKFKFVKISVPTPIAGLTAFLDTSIPVEWELSAGMDFQYISNTKSGFIYDSYNGRQDVDKKSRTVTFGLEGKAELKFGPQVDLGIDLLGGVVEASVGVGAGLKVEATAYLGGEDAVGDDADSVHACLLCIDGSLKWYVDVDAKLEVHIVKDVLDWVVFDLTIVELTGYINLLPRLTGGEFYISVINNEDSKFGGDLHFGGGSCSNKKYRVEIKSEDADGNETTGITVNVKNKNGTSIKSESTAFVLYLYDGVYTAEGTINRTNVRKSFVVNSSALSVVMSPSASDGKLNGQILDADSNHPVTGASVVITMGDMSFSTCTSDNSGSYTANLPAGTYKVEISKEGYIPFVTYVTVNEGSTEYLETTMLVSGDGQYMGGFSGTITNAVNNSPIPGVTLQIRRGWNNTTEGDVVTTLTTDENGYFEYDTWSLFGVVIGLQAGNYTAKAMKANYVTTDFPIIVIPGETKNGQDATMSPELESEEYRIVLTWGSSPSDLDSHFNGVTTDGYRDHIWYSDKTGYSGNLDVDDTSSYGPETITVTDFDILQDGFTYSVHDFSNRSSTSSTALASSGARVEVYCGSELIRTYNVPTGKEGTVWHVFSINKNGVLTNLNTFEYQSAPSAVGASFAANAVKTVGVQGTANYLKDYELR